MGRFCQISLCQVASYICPFSYSLPPQQAPESSSGMVSHSVLSHVQLFATPWTAPRQASLSFTNSQSLLKLMSIESVMPSNHLHPLLSPSPPIFNLSQHQGLFQWVSSSHEVAKVLEFQLQHQSFQCIFRTDFLRIDWFDLLAVQGTLKSLLQHHSSKASILQCSAFFIVQLSHAYMTTGKIIALTRQTFVGKVMSLLFNMLSRFSSKNIAFLPRGKFLLRSRHGRDAINFSCLRVEYQHVLFGLLWKRCVPSTPCIYPNQNTF